MTFRRGSRALGDDAPILLVGDDLSSVAENEIKRLRATRIVILGGPDAVSPMVGMQAWSILNGNDMPIWK